MAQTNSSSKAAGREPERPVAAAPETTRPGFFTFLFQEARQRNLILITLLVNALLLAGYKHFYPIPDFFSDSYGYVLSAAKELEIFYRPLGYSHFLSFLHGISESSTFVVAVHYFMLSLAGLFCFFSVDSLYGYRSKPVRLAVWILLTVNPLYLVLSNQIASDSLFTALTITWFTLLLWVLVRGGWVALALQLVVLLVAFEVRYNALYYPAVACIAFLLSRNRQWAYRITGIAVTIIAIAFSYNRIKETTERLTDAPVFAGFSGWQLANNALYVYPFAQVKAEEFDDPDLSMLNQVVTIYLDSLDATEKQGLKSGNLDGAIFLWSKNSPLKKYVQYYAATRNVDYMTAWYQVSETYAAFGQHIIRKHTGAFIQHYLLKNLGFFFMPSREKMTTYNADQTTIADDTRSWFHFDSIELKANGDTQLQRKIIFGYPALHALLVIISLVVPALFFMQMRRRKALMVADRNLLLYWYGFYLMNAGFSIFASVIALRYEAAWFVLSIVVPAYFLDRLLAAAQGDLQPAANLPN